MQQAPTTSSSKADLSADHPLRVFLVEDSAVIRERLTESISSLSHVEVVGHADTESGAISALDRVPSDAVVLDLQLRHGHGLNVLKALRGTPERPRPTVIVLTNFTSPQYRGRSMEFGADYFFDKSRDYDRVCDVLEELARRRAQNLS